MNILGLDLATNMGYALKSNVGITSGTVSFQPKRGDSPGMIFLRFGAWLTDTYNKLKKQDGNDISLLVGYEQPHHRGGRSTEVLVGMVAKVQEFCALHSLEHVSVHTATLKKFATGNGRASKEQMIESANNRFGMEINDDNEADALWVTSWASEEVGEPFLPKRVE